jgi:hypothetical protein
LAFHPYPRVIPPVFNRGGFGPPRGLTPASACPRIDHLASRPRRATVVARLSTRLRCGSPLRAWPRRAPVTRWLILQKARRHPAARRARGLPGSDCSWAHGFRCCFTPLSGCFSPFPHGTCPLSVTGTCSALEGGPPCFGPGFTCPALLGTPQRGPEGSAYGALTLCRRPSHAGSAPLRLSSPPGGSRAPRLRLPLPPRSNAPGALPRARVWAGPVSLAATPGISVDFLSSGYLDVSVPRVASAAPMCSARRGRALARPGSPIRRSAGRRPFAPRRGLSQLATSFLAVLCQGIRRAPSTPSRFRGGVPGPRGPPRPPPVYRDA